MTSTATKPTEKQTLPNNGVLFDEDYRAHIEKIMAKLERERHAVIKLREQIFELQRKLK